MTGHADRIALAPGVAAAARAASGGWAPPLLLGAMAGSMVAGRFETALLCVAIAIAVAAGIGAGLPPRRGRLMVGSGIGLAILLNLCLTPGRPIAGPVLGLTPTAEGLRAGLLFALRILGALAAVQGLRGAWPGERAADEVARLLRPLERLRVPVREARLLTGLALRFAPLLAEEARRIAALQDLRAGRPPRGFRERWTRRRAVVVPTLVSALERAERVALALDARHHRLRPLPVGDRVPAVARVAGGVVAGTALLWRG